MLHLLKTLCGLATTIYFSISKSGMISLSETENIRGSRRVKWRKAMNFDAALAALPYCSIGRVQHVKLIIDAPVSKAVCGMNGVETKMFILKILDVSLKQNDYFLFQCYFFDNCFYDVNVKEKTRLDFDATFQLRVMNSFSGHFRDFKIPFEVDEINKSLTFIPLEKTHNGKVLGVLCTSRGTVFLDSLYSCAVDFVKQKFVMLWEKLPFHGYLLCNNDPTLIMTNKGWVSNCQYTIYKMSYDQNDTLLTLEIGDVCAPAFVYNWSLVGDTFVSDNRDSETYFVCNLKTMQQRFVKLSDMNDNFWFVGMLGDPADAIIRPVFVDQLQSECLKVFELDTERQECVCSTIVTSLKRLYHVCIPDASTLFFRDYNCGNRLIYHRWSVRRPDSLQLLTFLKAKNLVMNNQIRLPSDFPFNLHVGHNDTHSL